ncbi:MAG TPA: hypothetical protein VL989_00360, partial [Candidatus Sulfotelmatobacter sp.]|nr:hypothetical protein [Candidatus Sulfotelmatobacter sp.]
MTNEKNGAIAEVFVPEAGAEVNDSVDQFTKCEVGGTPRLLSTDVLRMMLAFSQDEERRRTMLHDCAIFALACVTGDTYAQQLFDSGPPVKVGKLKFFAPRGSTSFLREPSIEAGEVAFTVDLSPIEPGFEAKTDGFHFMVRATYKYDPQGGLYASKLGV